MIPPALEASDDGTRWHTVDPLIARQQMRSLPWGNPRYVRYFTRLLDGHTVQTTSGHYVRRLRR